MGKLICDICGSTFQDAVQQCPICGYSVELGASVAQDELLLEDFPVKKSSKAARGGRFSASNVRKRSVSGEDFVDSAEDGMGEFMEEDDDKPQSNAFLIVLLTIVIVTLIVTTCFIFFRYFLPNNQAQEIQTPTDFSEQTDPSTQDIETTTIPCTSLSLTSGVVVELDKEGQKSLLNVVVQPSDCTDKIIYVSSDESVAVVNSEGRVTAVGEGEATITITCGGIQLDCKIICDFPDESGETGEP